MVERLNLLVAVDRHIPTGGETCSMRQAIELASKTPIIELLPLVHPTLIGGPRPTRGPERGLIFIPTLKGGFMDRFAIFLDAGYMLAAASQAISGEATPPRRKFISIASPAGLLAALQALAQSQCGIGSFLRMYWYDAMLGSSPSLEQSAIAYLPGAKLRLGTLNSAGEQKGVDSLIVTDLIELARNRAISDAIVISGDEDLRIAFQIAQSFGVRVHVLAVGDVTKNVSASLQMEADSVATLDAHWLSQHIQISKPAPPATATPVASTAPPSKSDSSKDSHSDAAKRVCEEIVGSLEKHVLAQLSEYFTTSKTIPPEFDRKLIAKTGALLGRQLDADEKRAARGLFVTMIRSSVGK